MKSKSENTGIERNRFSVSKEDNTLIPHGVKQISQELGFKTKEEILQICLRLAKFKKENKELLNYLLFFENEELYIAAVKKETDSGFDQITAPNSYLRKKSIRKILRMLKKYIRFSGKKETEAELLLHFCRSLKSFSSTVPRDNIIENILNRQLALAETKIRSLHDDLQYDFSIELEQLKDED